MKFFNKQLIAGRGFTLIETLVAVSILMVAIAGPLNIAEKALVTATSSRDQTIASYLAQDMLEYVENVRDDNVLATPSRSWLSYLSTCTSLTPCTAETAIDDPSNPVSIKTMAGIPCNFTSTPVVLSTDCELYINTASNTGYYTYASANNQATQFYRTFTVTAPTGGDGNSAVVTVSVFWANGNLLNRVILQSVIFNTHR